MDYVCVIDLICMIGWVIELLWFWDLWLGCFCAGVFVVFLL